MDALQVLFTAAALLLAIAGVQKWRDPVPVSRALQIARLPHGVAVVRAFAALELAVAVAALTVHHEIAALAVAALFLAFTVFVVSALARGLPIESCGCFGRADTRPSASHVAVDAALATVAFLVAVDDVAPVRALLADDVARGCGVLAVALVIAVLVTVWLRGSFTSSRNRATRSYRALR